ncbi:POK8 protein, partial [Serilophus lunatus]|nr:POK8 protein [Serilophus lunatus]
CDVCQHLLCAFAVLGVPHQMKTDIGPGYVTQCIKNFLQLWGVRPVTSIPHSPTGQAIVEWAHGT